MFRKVQSSTLQLPIDISKDSCPLISNLEHVQAITSLSVLHGTRGNLRISLRSASGTLSELLPTRHLDRHNTGFNHWPFMTVMNWGESPVGQWVYTVSTVSGARFTLDELTLVLYGISSEPVSVSEIPKNCSGECRSGCSKAGSEYCDTCRHKQVLSSLDCVQSCPARTYPLDNYCLDCSKYCSKCSNGNSCEKCDFGAYKLPSGLCNSTCTDSSVFINGSCQSCHFTCKTCNGLNENNCTSCHKPQYKLSSSGECVFHPNCSSAQYFEHRVLGCKSCHRTCLECSGRKESDCTTCSDARILVRGKCVDKTDLCSEGEYYSEATGSCALCPPNCRSCINDLLCTECEDESYIYSSLMERSNIRRTFCIGTCPDGYYGDREFRNCTFCSPACATCTGEATNCTTCVESGVTPRKGVCPTPCPPSQFFNYILMLCNSCPISCSSCTNGTYCTHCSPGLYLNARGQCYPECPNGTIQNPLSGQCEATKCHNSCQTCLGPSPSECLSCSSDHIFFLNKCWKSCPVGYYEMGTSEGPSCGRCHTSCRTCSGPTEGECLSCPRSRQYIDGYHCLQSCRSGYYADKDRVCSRCLSQCAQCVNGQSCSQCQSGAVLGPSGTCLTSCPAHYHNDDGVCIRLVVDPIGNGGVASSPGSSTKSWTVFILLATCLLLLGVSSILLLLFWKRHDLYLVLRRNRNKYVVLYTHHDEFEMNGQPASESETEIFSRSEPM